MGKTPTMGDVALLLFMLFILGTAVYSGYKNNKKTDNAEEKGSEDISLPDTTSKLASETGEDRSRDDGLHF